MRAKLQNVCFFKKIFLKVLIFFIFEQKLLMHFSNFSFSLILFFSWPNFTIILTLVNLVANVIKQ
jgi:hypothetical protein